MVGLGQYIPGSSLLHRLDPRVKIGSVIMMSILILHGDAITVAFLTLFLISLIFFARLNLHAIARGFKPMVVFFALLFFIHLFFTHGSPLLHFPFLGITITREGLLRGSIVVWDFSLLVLAASMLTMTTSPMELVSGIERLLRPFRIIGLPSHDVAMMVSIALRFLPTIAEEINRIREAQWARGADLTDGVPWRRIKASVSLMIPVVLGSFRRADQLAEAMEARAYQRGTRTYLRNLRMTGPDYMAAGVVVLITGLLALLPRLLLG